MITPILPVPLEGPAYFVSRGGEGWPSLVVVLQGFVAQNGAEIHQNTPIAVTGCPKGKKASKTKHH